MTPTNLGPDWRLGNILERNYCTRIGGPYRIAQLIPVALGEIITPFEPVGLTEKARQVAHSSARQTSSWPRRNRRNS